MSPFTPSKHHQVFILQLEFLKPSQTQREEAAPLLFESQLSRSSYEGLLRFRFADSLWGGYLYHFRAWWELQYPVIVLLHQCPLDAGRTTEELVYGVCRRGGASHIWDRAQQA